MVLAILQGRSNSSRFPRKVLQELHGQPMIVRQLERISRSARISRVVVATSVEGTDDELTEVVEAAGYSLRRGPLNDVLGRFLHVIDEFAPDHVVRLTADCPLTDPEVIDRVIDAHLSGGYDYTSNTLARTYPDGLDVECIRVDALRRAAADGPAPAEREHVTLGVYSKPNEFTLGNVEQETDHSDRRWTVDVPADLDFVRLVYGALYDADPSFGQREISDWLAENPELERLNSDVA